MSDKYSGVLLVTPDNKLILQQRDDNPKISNPGKIAVFGGSSEGDETPLETAIREIDEELSLKLNPDMLEPFLELIADDGQAVTLFVYRNVDVAKLVQSEGKKIVLVSKGDNLESLNLTERARQRVLTYFQKNP
jgi:8-oxo-dGTP diphosphatase